MIKVSLRNSGSKLGMAWEPLSTLIVSFALSVVWIEVLDLSDSLGNYLVYVYTGMVAWAAISGAISNLCATFIKNARAITNRKLPLFSYVFEELLISFIPFLLSLPFLLLVTLVVGHSFGLYEVSMILVGLSLMLITAFGFSLSIGLAAFFIGDIRQIVAAIMRLGFLITPVIWKAERLNEYENFLLLNPFYGFIHVMRVGFAGEELKSPYLIQAIGVTVIMSLLSVICFTFLADKMQHRALKL